MSDDRPIEKQHTPEQVWTEAHEWNKIIDQAAEKDNLTGLPNHGGYIKQINQEVARAKRSGDPLSLAVIDIDRFKSINDHYGHSEGDKVLQALAELLKKDLRIFDLPARYGGEEFTVIFPELPLFEAGDKDKGAAAASERLRSLIADNIKVKGRPVTVSVGVAQWRRGENAVDFFDRADRALLAAKKAGRNRIKATVR